MQTPRLLIRSFAPDDLAQIHRILDGATPEGTQMDQVSRRLERESWLRWSMLSQEWLPRLYQPAYGDRAVVLRSTGAVIGAVGYAPLLAPFERIPELRSAPASAAYNTPEVGLYWEIDPVHRRRGYAAEAAEALIQHAFTHMRLKRILAMTEYDNAASQGVMRKLGMYLARNPLPEPPWLQVVGILPNPG